MANDGDVRIDLRGGTPPILGDGTHSSFLHTILHARLDGFHSQGCYHHFCLDVVQKDGQSLALPVLTSIAYLRSFSACINVEP
jgi:hypothetical protein